MSDVAENTSPAAAAMNADPGNPLTLLQPRLDQDVGNWIGALGDRRAFRVRGFSWFKTHVEQNITAIVQAIADAKAEAQQRPGWKDLPFPWADQFSPRQVYDAANRKPLLFPKAALTILLCELAARARGRDAVEVYRKMRIEPAVYRISDFTRGTLESAESSRADIMNVLIRECGQQGSEVFYDLASGKTVSYRLASKIIEVMQRELRPFPQFRVGTVVVGTDRRYRNTSEEETVEGASVPTHPAS
jgi:hypothetical protein